MSFGNAFDPTVVSRVNTHFTAGHVPRDIHPPCREYPRASRNIPAPAGNAGMPPPKAGNIPAGRGCPQAPVIFPPAGNVPEGRGNIPAGRTVGPTDNKTVKVTFPASGGNIPGRPVISPRVCRGRYRRVRGQDGTLPLWQEATTLARPAPSRQGMWELGPHTLARNCFNKTVFTARSACPAELLIRASRFYFCENVKA